MIKILGILGGFCFAYCGVPAAYATIKARRSIGLPISTATMILIGAVAMYGYLTATYGFDLILTINYTIEALSWGVIVFYHFFGESELTAKFREVKVESESYWQTKSGQRVPVKELTDEHLRNIRVNLKRTGHSHPGVEKEFFRRLHS